MVFSCGLWGIVWAILILSDNPQFHCAQCGYSDEVKYLANPYLRSEEAQRNSEQGWQGRSVTQEVSLLLSLGIFIMPYVFAWFTLREGYSSWARKVSFGWLTVFVIYMIFLFGYILPNQGVRQTSVEPPRQSPTSSATPLPTPLSPAQARRETFNENPTVWVAGCKDGFKTGKVATIDAEGNEWGKVPIKMFGRRDGFTDGQPLITFTRHIPAIAQILLKKRRNELPKRVAGRE